MYNSLVSIIIPTYNRAHLIGETLDSVLAQTYTNWECIIVDDGSTDNTPEVINDYIKIDNRLQYYHRPDDRLKGANACRNYGYQLSKGEYIKWFDSDDIMHSDFLEKQVLILEEKKELDFCASFSEMFDDKIGKRWPCNPEKTENHQALYNYITGKLIFLTPSPLWRRQFLNKKVLFDELLLNAHEADFNFKRLIEGAKFEYIKEILFYVRRGHESIDLNSIKDPFIIKSMFDYYQKVYIYLCQFSVYLSINQRLELRNHILFKQNCIFYSLQILKYKDKHNEVFFVIIDNIRRSKFKVFYQLQLIIGILSIYIFKKGYRLIFKYK